MEGHFFAGFNTLLQRFDLHRQRRTENIHANGILSDESIAASLEGQVDWGLSSQIDVNGQFHLWWNRADVPRHIPTGWCLNDASKAVGTLDPCSRWQTQINFDVGCWLVTRIRDDRFDLCGCVEGRNFRTRSTDRQLRCTPGDKALAASKSQRRDVIAFSSGTDHFYRNRGCSRSSGIGQQLRRRIARIVNIHLNN